MSKNDDKSFLLPDTLIKNKLNSIWSEVQTNLPTISFDENGGDENDDNDDLLLNRNDEDEEYDDELLIKDPSSFFIENKYNTNDNDENETQFDSIYVNNNLNENLFNNDYSSDSENHIKSSLLSSSEVAIKIDKGKENLTNYNENSAISNLRRTESAAIAAKITKSIFEPSSSKLNMEIFDYVDINELVESLPNRKIQKITSINNATSHNRNEINDLYDNTKNRDKNFLHRHHLKMCDNDEKVLQKLHAMSMQLYEKSAETTSRNTASNTDENINKQDDSQVRNEKFSDLIYEPYGNYVETKRIDLRPKANDEKTFKNTKLEKFEKLFNYGNEDLSLENMMKSVNLREIDNKNQWTLSNGDVNKNHQTKFRVFNRNSKFDESETSSDEESEDDDDNDTKNNSLWIERYRKQKLKMNQN